MKVVATLEKIWMASLWLKNNPQWRIRWSINLSVQIRRKEKILLKVTRKSKRVKIKNESQLIWLVWIRDLHKHLMHKMLKQKARKFSAQRIASMQAVLASWRLKWNRSLDQPFRYHKSTFKKSWKLEIYRRDENLSRLY